MVIVAHVKQSYLLKSNRIWNALSEWKRNYIKPLEVQLFERKRQKHSDTDTIKGC